MNNTEAWIKRVAITVAVIAVLLVLVGCEEQHRPRNEFAYDEAMMHARSEYEDFQEAADLVENAARALEDYNNSCYEEYFMIDASGVWAAKSEIESMGSRCLSSVEGLSGDPSSAGLVYDLWEETGEECEQIGKYLRMLASEVEQYPYNDASGSANEELYQAGEKVEYLGGVSDDFEHALGIMRGLY